MRLKLIRNDTIEMENMLESCVPPGFRFHPTEEELVGYYLKRKIDSLKNDLDVIVEIDLYKMEPWDIQARSRLLGYSEQNEWYFFSHKDRKYPTGTRTNRATAAGFWKATGRDKPVLSKNRTIGMRKTLVFYKGRAPNGRKTDWIIHEYRLQTSEHDTIQEEGWVVCRAFKKPVPNQRPSMYEPWLNQMYCTNTLTNYDLDSASNSNTDRLFEDIPYRPDFGSTHQMINMELPQLDSPGLSPSLGVKEAEGFEQEEEKNFNGIVDWKTLDSLLATQATDSYLATSLPPVARNFEFESIDSHIFGSL